MTMSVFTIIIIVLFAFWRGFTSGANMRAREMLVAHGHHVESTWLEWASDKAADRIWWIGSNLGMIFGWIVLAVILFVVGSVVFQMVF